MKLLICVIALASMVYGAEKRVLTEEEKKIAYTMSVDFLKEQLSLPATVRFQPIEEAQFSTGIKSRIDIRFYVEQRNPFGATKQTKLKCEVWTAYQGHPVCYINFPYGPVIGSPFGK